MVGRRKAASRGGFNMLEVTISTLLVSVLLTTSMTTTGVLIRRNGMRAQSDVKMSLAHDLLSEMSQASFTDSDRTQTSLGPEYGEASGNRSRFDDIDDYDQWSEMQIQDKMGSPIAGLTGYRRSVRVQYVRLMDPEVISSLATDLKRITIEVSGPDSDMTQLIALRSRCGALDVMPGVQSTFVRSVRMRLDADQSSHAIHSGAGLLNQPTVGDEL